MNVLEQAIYARLTGTPALVALLATPTSVFNQIAPQGSTYPYTLFQLLGGGDQNESPHRSQDVLYLVKAIVGSGFLDAGAIDAQIDAALHGIVLAVTGWTNYWCRRASSLSYVEIAADGRRYYHNGGTYRLRIAQ